MLMLQFESLGEEAVLWNNNQNTFPTILNLSRESESYLWNWVMTNTKLALQSCQSQLDFISGRLRIFTPRNYSWLLVLRAAMDHQALHTNKPGEKVSQPLSEKTKKRTIKKWILFALLFMFYSCILLWWCLISTSKYTLNKQNSLSRTIRVFCILVKVLC